MVKTLLSLTTISILVFALAPQTAQAENLQMMRRWVVFPYDTDATLKAAGENAWWKFREKLTSDRKYLVASRQFLMQKDAFQPRKDLSPDDVKLLAHLLDADVVVTGFSEHRQFTLNVYLAQNGELFWSKHLSFHPSLKAPDQLELISDKLSQELLAQIPYQAFTITDPLIGKPIYEEGGKKLVIVDVGSSEDLGVGTDLQWVNVMLPEKTTSDPLVDRTKIAVVAEGKVIKVRRGVVVAELQKAQTPEAVTERTLVRIPRLAEKLTKNYVASGVGSERLAPEMIPTLINPVAPESSGAKKNTLIFGSIFSVLGILILAF